VQLLFGGHHQFAEDIMSTKNISQMEAVLMEKIEKAKIKLSDLQQKHKLEMGNLAYKHGLHNLEMSQLDNAFAKMAEELNRERS
jgi:hypothetical protein